MKLSDTHCHLFFEDYDRDLNQVLERARQAGITRILVPGVDLKTSRELLELIDREEMLFGAVGVHPNSADSWNDSDLAVLKELTLHPKVVAVGEIGLDYFRDRSPRERQKEILIKQLDLAASRELPVVLHVRNRSQEDRTCMEDLLEILEVWSSKNGTEADSGARSPGVIHSFSGNTAEAARAVKTGFYIGITGPVTYRNAEELRAVIQNTDPAHLLIETDGPFLSPQKFRGKRNEPAHVRYIVDKISELIGLPPELIADITSENAASLFKWE